MLLETLDIRKKDFMIFSQNKFDFTNNFKIINKSQSIRRPQKISYFEVCEIVKNPIPKNLIIYRLLTNVSDLDAYSTKYGYFIKINGKPELVYFDPVFAIKDIRHLRFDFDPSNFRFKIQQTGLTSKSVQGNEADYDEIFSFDLKAHEAQNQNDKIFADAIFAFDESYVEEDEMPDIDEIIERKLNAELAKDMDSSGITQLKNISEEKKQKTDKLNKAHFVDSSTSSNIRDEKIQKLKNALGISVDERSSIDEEENEKENTGKDSEVQQSKESLFDLFKSTAKFSDLESRTSQSFILKLKEDN